MNTILTTLRSEKALSIYRSAGISAGSVLLLAILQGLSSLDFGDYTATVTAVLGFAIATTKTIIK